MDEIKLRNALKVCLSQAADFPAKRRQAVLNAVRQDESRMKKRFSAVLVFAILTTLLLFGAAVAAGFGAFGRAANDAENEQSAARLNLLESVAANTDDEQTARAPDAPEASVQPQTLRDRMLDGLYGRAFSLTLDQTYCDGKKLYYSYTLTANEPPAWYECEGSPSGFDAWDMQMEGKYVDCITQNDEELQKRFEAFFTQHPVGYVVRESFGLGDGADLNGEPLTILDSGETTLDERSVQGFQEVLLPEGYDAADDLVEIELSVLYGANVYYQDENYVYWAHVVTPENRGILHFSFTAPVNGRTETYSGETTTDAYTVRATVSASQVELSGEAILDAPRETAALADDSTHMPSVVDYALIANGVEYPDLDGAYGLTADGKLFIRLRYDLPDDLTALTLRPIYSDRQNAPSPERNANEEIRLERRGEGR